MRNVQNYLSSSSNVGKEVGELEVAKRKNFGKSVRKVRLDEVDVPRSSLTLIVAIAKLFFFYTKLTITSDVLIELLTLVLFRQLPHKVRLHTVAPNRRKLLPHPDCKTGLPLSQPVVSY